MIGGKEWIGVLSLAVGSIGDVAYIGSILRGKTRPHAFTWVVWELIMSIVFLGQLAAGAGPGAWLTGYNVLINVTIIFLSFQRGERRITRGDWIVLAIALAGVPVWCATRDPTWSICLESALATGIFWPTVRKSYVDPFSETIPAWILFAIPVVVALLAMDTYSFATVLYPAASAILDIVFIVMLLWRRRVLGGT